MDEPRKPTPSSQSTQRSGSAKRRRSHSAEAGGHTKTKVHLKPYSCLRPPNSTTGARISTVNYELDLPGLAAAPLGAPLRPGGSAKQRRAPSRANGLNGKTWTKYSISIWSDIRKSDEESQLAKRHPALFPSQLVTRLLECFMAPGDRMVLDPFAGSGSTMVAAEAFGAQGIGFEVYPRYIQLARHRLDRTDLFDQAHTPTSVIHLDSALNLGEYLSQNSIDFVFTSPPYWDVLSRRRSADLRVARKYGEATADLGRQIDYEDFLTSLAAVFEQVRHVLKPNKYCVVNVMDLRKANRFFPLHADLASRMEKVGFEWDDLIIWDRRHEYNNMRPLGFPAVFRVNKAHEFLLIFKNRKPA